MTTGRYRGSGVAAMAALVLAACSTGQACPAAGCVSIVQVDLAELHRQLSAGAAATASFCVEGACRDQTLDGAQGLVMADVPESAAAEGSSVRVTLRVVRGSETLADTALTAPLKKSAPNGERCGPVCFSALLTLHDGRLTPSAP